MSIPYLPTVSNMMQYFPSTMKRDSLGMFIGGEGGGAWGLRVVTISKIQDKVRPISLHYVTGHLVAIYWAFLCFQG